MKMSTDIDSSYSNLGIRIIEYKSMSKCISIIRNYRSDSMAIIKSEIKSHYFIFVFDFTNTPNLQRMLKCYNELTRIGCTLTIQEKKEIIPRQILINPFKYT